MASTPDKDDTYQIILDCETRESKLSDWERGFIDSISRQFTAAGELSPKQLDRLNQIWDRIT